MSIIAKYKFDKTIYADLLPEFNAEFTSDKYNTTDEEVDGIITRTIESDELPTLMRFGSNLDTYVEGSELALLEILEMNTSGLTTCLHMFRLCKNLTSITCEWDTSNVTNMYAMFHCCNKLTTLDVSNFDTSNVTTMRFMFYDCTNLTSLDVSNWDTSKVDNMQYMFSDCTNLITIDVSNWDTSNVDNMQYMFQKCSNLTTLDVSNFNTSKVTDMSSIFNHCYNLTSLDVSNFDTSKVTNMTCMFNYCQSLISLDVSNFDISKVIRMDGMFSAANKLISLDISNFNISDTTNIDYILSNTPLLTDIGMLYCDQSTINKIASVLPTDITQTIWVEDVDVKDLTPVEGVEFKQYAKNTEIMLTSPLLEGDKLIVKDGKTYHYHKMGKVVLDGSEDWGAFEIKGEFLKFGWQVDFLTVNNGLSYCDRFITATNADMENTREQFCPFRHANNSEFRFTIKPSRLSTPDVNGFKQWLQANPTTVVYELASPYYELISEDPLDISLISETVDITNSSNIPLNMTINNKGLSTVAMSPSTTYTVAFDKEGEEDLTVNLCGNEITTSNNVVEITTSSELGNNELIFYGDGVEVSNVRLLEGSISGDSVPRESFEGLKNSFEDGYISENLVDMDSLDVVSDNSIDFSVNNLVVGNQYTIRVRTSAISSSNYFSIGLVNEEGSEWCGKYTIEKDTYLQDEIDKVVCITATENVHHGRINVVSSESLEILELIILEGDWTHLSEEDWNNLGKYKVEYKVTGKNKFDGELRNWSIDPNTGLIYSGGNNYSNTNAIKIKGGQYYKFTHEGMTSQDNISKADLWCCYYDHSMNFISLQTSHVITPQNAKYLYFYFVNPIIKNDWYIQIEEGTVSTPYEPYKSYTKTFYLNSPLLEGDTIEDINGVATHVHRYEKIVLDGSEDWAVFGYADDTLVSFKYAIDNTTGIPTYRYIVSDRFKTLVSNETRFENWSEGIALHGWTYGNVICISKSKLSTPDINGFKQWLQANPTTVVYQLASPIYEPISTESILCDSYVSGHLDFDTNIPIEKIEFIPTSLALAYLQPSTSYTVQFESDNVGEVVFGIGGTDFGEYIVHKGLNKFHDITNSSLTNNRLWMSGIGFNASNIQVVATDRNADFGYFKGLQSSFEEKTAENLFDESCLSTWWLVTATNIDKTDTSGKYFSIITKAEEGKKYTIKYDYMNRYIYAFLDENYNILRGSSETSMFTTFQAPKNTKYLMCYISSNGIKEEDYDNIQVVENSENFGYEVKCKVVGKNKFDKSNVVLGYWGTDSTTYHTNIPSVFSHKTPIKVKPNTWYTMQSLGVTGNVYVVGLHPFESILVVNNSRASFYTNNRTEVYIQINTENTDLSKFLDIIQLEEGTQATSYEPYQEYTKTIYLNSPLLKGDTIEVHNGKLCHYHKMGMVVLDGSEDEELFLVNADQDIHIFGSNVNTGSSIGANVISNNFAKDDYIYDNRKKGIMMGTDGWIRICLGEVVTLDEFKAWLQNNPITVVYELAEPYYEEISPTQEDLIITSVKEGDLHIDTIVPISSKVTYNVNVQLLTDFEQSIVEQVQATQTTDLQSILDEEIDN